MLKKLFGGTKNRTRRQNVATNFTSQIECNDREEDGFVLVGESAIERSTIWPVDSTTGLPYLNRPPTYESQLYAPGDASIAPLYHIPYLTATAMGQRPSNQVTTEANPEYVADGDIQTTMESFQSEQSATQMQGLGTYHGSVSALHTPRGPNNRASVVSTLPGEILSEEEFCAAAATPRPGAYISPIDGVPFKLAPWLEFSEGNWSCYEYLSIPNINIEDYNYDFAIEKSLMREYQDEASLTTQR